VFYHAYSTYIKASNQVIGEKKKTTQKGTNIPKAKKNYTKIIFFLKIETSQKYVQKSI